MNKQALNAIKHLLSKGYAFTVWDSIDGDAEIDVRNATDLDVIMDCLGSTESNKLVLKEFTPEGFRAVGKLIFVYEYDEDDVLHDYSAADEDVDYDIREAFALIV